MSENEQYQRTDKQPEPPRMPRLKWEVTCLTAELAKGSKDRGQLCAQIQR